MIFDRSMHKVHMSYRDLVLKPDVKTNKFELQFKPSIQDVSSVADELRIFDPPKRRSAIESLKYVINEDEYWQCGPHLKRCIPSYNGTYPYDYCLSIDLTQPLNNDDKILYSVKMATHLLLVWYVYHISQMHNTSVQETLELFFIVYDVDKQRDKERKRVPPTASEQIARTCYCSEILKQYVKKKMDEGGSTDEFLHIKSFLDDTLQGKQLLKEAGVSLTVGYELDHYVPKNMGGLSIVQNAHILPKDGSNQHYGSNWNHHKRKFCGEDQYKAIFDPSTGLCVVMRFQST